MSQKYVIDVMISMVAYELENSAILNVKRVDYRCDIWNMARNDAINKLNNYEIWTLVQIKHLWK